MRWLNENRSILVAGALAGAVGAAVVLLIFLSVGRFGKAADWAAWVQALGSIAAVAGAAWIAVWQGQQARLRDDLIAQAAKAEREALDRARMLAASRLVTLFSIQLTAFCEVTKRSEPREQINPLSLRRLDLARLQIERFPIDQLRDSVVVVCFCDALSQADMAVRMIEKLDEILRRFPGHATEAITSGIGDIELQAKTIEEIDEMLRGLAEPGWKTRAPASTDPGQSTAQSGDH